MTDRTHTEMTEQRGQKGRAPRAVLGQIARIREAVMLRRRLSTKALSLDLGLPIGVIKYYSRQVKL